MSCENTSRSMRYYTIEYNRLLHRMIYAVNTTAFSKSIGQSMISLMLPLCRSASAMSGNVRRYVSDMPVRKAAAEISENCIGAINMMQADSRTAAAVHNTEADLLHFEKSVLCINNSMFSDMSEFVFEHSIARRYIREMLPLCTGIAEIAALAQRFPVCDELKETMSDLLAGLCEVIGTLEGLSIEI